MSMYARTQRRRRTERRARFRAEAEEVPAPTPQLAEAKPATEVHGQWVDLLHHTPLAPVATDALIEALRFAFESGDAGGMLGLTVDQAPVAKSNWDPRNFASGLFLKELVTECFPIEVEGRRITPSEGRLVTLLSHPPEEPRDTSLRQEVLRELCARPELHAVVGRLYVKLRQLRRLLDEQPMTPGETIRRKVEVLDLVKRFFDEANEGLEGTTSALARLHGAAAAVCARPVYERLAQVLEFDRHMASIEVRLVLGSDGRIRDFELMRTDENTANVLVRSPWSRAWSRLRAWLRGYRYTENEVLLKVLDEVFDDLEDALLPCFRLVGDLEFYLAAMGFRARSAKVGLEVCLPELSPTPALEAPAGPLELRRLFNPLLWLQKVEPVPCDVHTTGHDALVLVTGPNSGGKTRLLQAVALSQLLAHGGVFVPAKEARLTRAPNMFVSLIEEAPADQKEGRLGTELMRVRRLFEQLTPGCFVALDEVCSGTNPSEGIAIFEMVVSLLPRLRPQVLLTTHFLDAARKLETERPAERLLFLQVELDDQASPTFQFVPGVAPTSLAHRVASRLGVTREELEALVERQAALLDES